MYPSEVRGSIDAAWRQLAAAIILRAHLDLKNEKTREDARAFLETEWYAQLKSIANRTDT